jgi:hypothetical protein
MFAPLEALFSCGVGLGHRSSGLNNRSKNTACDRPGGRL